MLDYFLSFFIRFRSGLDPREGVYTAFGTELKVYSRRFSEEAISHFAQPSIRSESSLVSRSLFSQSAFAFSKLFIQNILPGLKRMIE